MLSAKTRAMLDRYGLSTRKLIQRIGRFLA